METQCYFLNMFETCFLMLFKVVARPILYPPLSATHLHTQAVHHILSIASQESKSINSNFPITMPKQGPGTKLVMKGLKRAFPKIAEQREQEEREEREEQESRKRDHVSHNTNGENWQKPSIHSKSGHPEVHGQSREHSRHGSSVHSNTGSRRSQTQPEGNNRPESVRGGSSIHSNASTLGSRNQSRDTIRSGSIRQRHSNHSDAGHRASHGQFKGKVPPEVTLQRPSNHSNAENTGNRASHSQSKYNTPAETTGQRLSIRSNSEHHRGPHNLSEHSSHEPIHPSLATELQRRKHGPNVSNPSLNATIGQRSERGEAAEHQTEGRRREV